MAKEQQKLEALNRAALEVEQFENLIECLTSVHRDCGRQWDWNEFLRAPEPSRPTPVSNAENAAQRALDGYKGSWFDRLLKRTEKKRRRLEDGVLKAKAVDAEATARATREFSQQHEEWREMRDLASRVLRLEERALRDAIEELSPFKELSDLGSHVSFVFPATGVIGVTLAVNSDSVIPTETKSLLQSGKLSVKKMPVGQFYELYQDYVAGAALRIARELFALLPIHTVYVTAVANMLDTSTGHLREQPILSVGMPRTTIQTLRFEAVDPSDALRNFNHRMLFKKTKGFSPIEPLSPQGA